MRDGNNYSVDASARDAPAATHAIDMDAVVPPTDIDACVRFSAIRCLLTLVSLVLVATDIPRTGLGLRSLSDFYPQVSLNAYLYFGPYAYPVTRIYRHETADSVAAAQYTGTSSDDAIVSVELWPYKFDTLSIPSRALAKYLNVSAYPPCVLYREPCRGDTLSLETVFLMNDALVTALQVRKQREPRQSQQLKIVTTSLWIDHVHHAIVKPLWRHTQKRFHSILYYEPTSAHLQTNVCDPSVRAPRPEICYYPVPWRCDHPTFGSSGQVLIWEHIALRLQALRDQHPDLVFDLTVVSSRTRLERSRVMYIPNIYYLTDNPEVTTLIRGRVCATDRVANGSAGANDNACTTVVIDDFRYERAIVRTDLSAWYFFTSALRTIGQVYIWIRVVCLWVGCYNARAAEPKFRTASWRSRVAHCVLTFTKIPGFVVVYGSWVPVVCYAAAHYIDNAMYYLMNEAHWISVNGLTTFQLSEFVVVASVQMRNIWFVALFLKLATALHHQVFEERTRRWMPVYGLARVRGVLIGGVSILTVGAQVRLKAFRDVAVTSVAELSHDLPIHSDVDLAMRNASEYGFQFDLKLLAIALVLICAVALVVDIVAPLVVSNANFVVASRSHFVPFSVDTLWSRDALVAYWLVRPDESVVVVQPPTLTVDPVVSQHKPVPVEHCRWRFVIASWRSQRVRVAPADVVGSSIGPSDSSSSSTDRANDVRDAVRSSARMLSTLMMQPSISECPICRDKLAAPTRFRWQSVQGCPTHDSLAHLELRTIEHWSIARLTNIAMLTDPLVLVRLYYGGYKVYIYRRTTTCTLDLSASVTVAAAPAAAASPLLLLLPCPIEDIQESVDDTLPSFYDRLHERWDLVATVNAASLPWTALVSCG